METETTIIAATSSNVANPEISIWKHMHHRQRSEQSASEKGLEEVIFRTIDLAFIISLRMLIIVILGLLMMDAVVSIKH